MRAYKFSECAAKVKPDNEITRLLEKAMSRHTLVRAEKDRIAEICYGPFGNGSATYKLSGWAWVLWSCLSKYVVEGPNGHLQYCYAADKTALRKTLPSVKRIIKVW